MALRQSSVFWARKPPTTSAPVAATGASAWKGWSVRRVSPRTAATSARARPATASPWNRPRLERRLGNSATRVAPTKAPHSDLRPPSTTPSRRMTVSSYWKPVGWRYWKLRA
jgi:hypothetical protein